MGDQRILFLGDRGLVWSGLAEQLAVLGLQGELWEHQARDLRRENLVDVLTVLIGPSIQGKERLEACRHVRALSLCPLVVITSGLTEIEELRLAAVGVCDIVHLPLRPRVMAAQLAIRISQRYDEVHDEVLSYRRLQVNPIEHVASIEGQSVELTKTEFDLLVLLMKNPRRVHTHEEISRWLWDDPWVVDHHRLEAHVCRLRKKVSRAGGPAIIGSVRGVGYRLVASADLTAAPHPAG